MESESDRSSPSLLSSSLKNRAAKTNPAQWALMIDFLSEHPEMVTKSFNSLDARKTYQQLWNQLANNLNSMGYGAKSTEKWIEAFGKWKSKTKSKAQLLRLGMNKTGGGGPLPSLNVMEEKLMGIIGWTIVDGDGTPELGLDTSVNMPSTCSQPTSSLAIITPPPLVPLTPQAMQNQTLDNIPVALLTPQATTQSQTPLNILSSSEILETVATTHLGPSSLSSSIISKKRKSWSQNNNKQPLKKRATIADETNLLKMHQETLSVLRDINANIGRIADKELCNNCKCKCACGNS